MQVQVEQDFTHQTICYFPGIEQAPDGQLHAVHERKIYSMQVGATIAEGGEGRIHAMCTALPLCGKIFYPESRDQTRFLKIEAMRRNPPQELPMSSIAWPLSYIHTADAFQRQHEVLQSIGRSGYIGYLMPKLDTTQFVPLNLVTDPLERSKKLPHFTWKHLLHTAMNLAHVVAVFHKLGYVIGDLSERNILVNASAQIGIVDCDSMQVRDPQSGHIFRTNVFTEGYEPPELASGAVDIRQVQQDNYSLAIIIFKLLLENWHPSGGVLLQPVSLSYKQRLVVGVYSFIDNPYLFS